MSFTIPDELLQVAHISEEEIKREIALLLFQKGKLTLEQCSRVMGIDRIQCQHILASLDIPIHYTKEDLQEDMKTLRKLEVL